MGNNQITGLSDPSANDHAVNQKYVNDDYLSLYGNNQMGSTLDMNDNRITGLTTDILYPSEAVNKQYVDNGIIKVNIKASHTSRNVFQYLMDDVNEWSTEYGAILTKIDDLDISPHYWNKKCLFVSPVKRLGSYMWKVGIQCFRLITNQTYTLVIELSIRTY